MDGITEWSAWVSAVLGIGLTEALLSVDNALIIAVVAAQLVGRQAKVARITGQLGGIVLRLVALMFASFIIENSWVRVVGALYLIFVTCHHFGHKKSEEAMGAKKENVTFWQVVGQIAVLDIIFSIDNVVTAVAITRSWNLMVMGVIVGCITMIFAAELVDRLMKRFPALEPAAYLVVGFIGWTLLLEELTTFHSNETIKFGGILLMIAGSLTFGASPTLQRRFRPVFEWCEDGMHHFAGLFLWAAKPEIAVLRRMVGLVKSKVKGTDAATSEPARQEEEVTAADVVDAILPK